MPGCPHRVQGRRAVADLYRGYGDAMLLTGADGLAVHRDRAASVVVLEYAVHGRAARTGRPCDNRFVSVITIKDRRVSHWRDCLDPVAVFRALGWPGGSGDRLTGGAVAGGARSGVRAVICGPPSAVRRPPPAVLRSAVCGSRPIRSAGDPGATSIGAGRKFAARILMASWLVVHGDESVVGAGDIEASVRPVGGDRDRPDAVLGVVQPRLGHP